VWTCLNPCTNSTDIPWCEFHVPFLVTACYCTGSHSSITTFCSRISIFLLLASLNEHETKPVLVTNENILNSNCFQKWQLISKFTSVQDKTLLVKQHEEHVACRKYGPINFKGSHLRNMLQYRRIYEKMAN